MSELLKKKRRAGARSRDDDLVCKLARRRAPRTAGWRGRGSQIRRQREDLRVAIRVVSLAVAVVMRTHNVELHSDLQHIEPHDGAPALCTSCAMVRDVKRRRCASIKQTPP